MISKKRAAELRLKVIGFASHVLNITASQGEMPESKSDEEDEWMREELSNIADDLMEKSLP